MPRAAIFAGLLVGLCAAHGGEEPPAFPGAVGFGASSRGGRGGDVYHVTTLEDGESRGTLRYGIRNADGPRTIVFDVGGTIRLKSALRIHTSRLTLAGQTAPGGGITIAKFMTVFQDVSDIIVRYVRFRTGDSEVEQRGGKLDPNLADALGVTDCERVMVDHVSASWSIDENFSLVGSSDVTLQYSIVSESLHDSFHEDGPHGMATLIRGNVSERDRRDGVGGFTFYRNLFAHNDARNPGVGGQQSPDDGQDKDDLRGLDLDFVNNVIYDWGSRSGHTVTNTNIRMNYISNYLVAGPSTEDQVVDVAMTEFSPGDFFIYPEGNYMDSDQDRKEDGRSVGDSRFQFFSSREILSEPFAFPSPRVFDAEDAYEDVLDSAGASWRRDEVDERVVDQVRRRRGGIIDSQEEVGGLPWIAGGELPRDSDGDGMPDRFEELYGLDPNDDDDRNEKNLSDEGYTNLETYLNALVRGEAFPEEPWFLRGDCDGDGVTCSGVTDALVILEWLFAGSSEPECLAACDTDATGQVELTDAITNLQACFVGGLEPEEPFPECGLSRRETDASLGCETRRDCVLSSPGP